MFILWLLFIGYQALMFDKTNITCCHDELHNVICQFGPYGYFVNEDDQSYIWRCRTSLSYKYIIRYSKIICTDRFNFSEWKYNLNCEFIYYLGLNQQYLQSRNRSQLIDSREGYFITYYDYVDGIEGLKLFGFLVVSISLISLFLLGIIQTFGKPSVFVIPLLFVIYHVFYIRIF